MMNYLAEALKYGNRPSDKSDNAEERCLGLALIRYTSENSGCYDPVFTMIIRKLRPDWFKHSTKNKNALLELARSGAKRPRKGGKAKGDERRLGVVLCNYTNASSQSYDPVFDEMIRRLRPDWFIRLIDKNKEKLLVLARSGAERPSSGAKDDTERKLGQVLIGYTCKSKSHYNSVFDKKIRKLRPDWFNYRGPRPGRGLVLTLFMLKRDLLLLAECHKSKRPSKRMGKTTIEERRLGRIIEQCTNCNYKYYDPAFDKKIRKLRPDWFKRRYTNELFN